ncbi:MAG TPA: thiamine-phosphate kinase [Spirochaetota bacterium]|nr:thiamine-phosphate kinase [Spirochaetota bacterium]
MITGEFDLIRSIRELVRNRQGTPEGITGIGDDCAVYSISEGRYGLFSTDMSLEGVHFDLSFCSYHDAGYRSMAANVSDIYAMGGRPLMAFVSLGIPSSAQEDDIIKVYDGMIECAAKHGVFIAGGDTVSSEKLILSVSIYGETARPVMRSGAEPGDYVYVTGSTGGSLLGLELLQSGADVSAYPESAAKHLCPEPCLNSSHVVSEYSPTSMIDISDGLAADLGHLCEESRCGYELYAERIPAPREVTGYCKIHSLDPLKYTLHSGEEYQLIFTSKLKIEDDNTVSLIGKIIPEGKYITINNSRKPVTEAGFDHFKRRG